MKLSLRRLQILRQVLPPGEDLIIYRFRAPRTQPRAQYEVACHGQWHSIDQVPLTVPCCKRIYFTETKETTL
jgi:hypothetical protein